MNDVESWNAGRFPEGIHERLFERGLLSRESFPDRDAAYYRVNPAGWWAGLKDFCRRRVSRIVLRDAL